MIDKPLFNTDEDNDDPDSEDGEGGRKGVTWGADVADNNRNAVRNQKRSASAATIPTPVLSH